MRHQLPRIRGVAMLVVCAVGLGGPRVHSASAEQTSESAQASSTHAATVKPSGWTRVTSASFTLVGNASRDRLARAAWHLERFRAAVLTIMPGIPSDSLVPLTVVTLEDPREFNQYLWRSGRNSVGGYFLPGDDEAYMVYPLWSGDDGLSVAFHEYSHALLRRAVGDVPSWFDEGLAEVFSTFGGSEKDSRSMVGRPLPHHLALLRSRAPLPLGRLFSAEGSDQIRQSGSETRLFYAQAWALTHYLVIGEGGARRAALMAFIDDQRRGVPIETAFGRHFGVSIVEMERALSEYVRRQLLEVVEIHVDVLPPPPEAIRTMSEADALRVQADLQMRIGGHAVAERKLEQARRLEPSNTAARVTLGRLRIDQGRAAEAVAELEDAGREAPKDPRVWAALGDALLAADRSAEALDAYERALATGSTAPAVYFGRGVAAMALERWSVSTLAFATVRRLDPSPAWQARRAIASVQQGRGAMAVESARLYLERTEWTTSSRTVALAGVVGSLLAKRSDRLTFFVDTLAAHSADDPFLETLLRVLRGETSGAALLRRSISDDQRAEARALLGFMALLDGSRALAVEHFRAARALEQPTVPRRWAVSELDRLERQQPPDDSPDRRE